MKANADDRYSGEPSEFRQYRAPRANQEVFVDPPLDEAAGLLAENRRLLAQHDSRWSAMRHEARAQMIKDAVRYTRVYRDTSWVSQDAERPIVMAGHQPSLFHPGVWFKNFALSHLSAKLNATAVNLVVDNDVAQTSAIRVPTIDPATGLAAYRSAQYDVAGGGVPYEQTTVGDRKRFDRFDREVAQAVRPLVADPCIEQLWPHARAAIDRCGVAGCALAQARHALEGDIGLKTLELPLGVFCRSRAFAEFALSILTEMPRFQQCYNESSAYYRAAHGIRSSAHPVPDLADKDDWFEAPLWIYGNQSPHRKAAWVRMRDDAIEISDLGNRTVRIETRNLSDAIDQLTAAMTPEFKLRPRALLTTMYSRLVLSDLFLHGIGGGKYDQLGDMVTKAFFEITPPRFMVLSATVHLPGVEPKDVAGEVRALRRRIRETHFQGERYRDEPGVDSSLVDQKQALLRQIPPRGERTQWHQKVTRVNRLLADQLMDVRQDLQRQLAAAQRRAVAQSVLTSREHSFCVYPLDYLTESFYKMLG
ncbi:hypothetical protein K239x_49310 [Planctomycetes bacterium K23_9]|uniref:Uncharacterized protein n=2 Tax=Stieleria marina TaxID=1930275 RepID=A0A517P0L9_9BACT|nr:hypothetical protein K239x_49310 [Planctomycetes bacterium K23_9]